MEKPRIRGLIARASKDIELAKGYMQLKEYVTAALLYNKAVEKVMQALFISKTRKKPPANASLEYLAKRTGMPDEVSVYITSLKEGTTESEPAEFTDFEYGNVETRKSAETEAFYLDGLTRRLLDYVIAYVKV